MVGAFENCFGNGFGGGGNGGFNRGGNGGFGSDGGGNGAFGGGGVEWPAGGALALGAASHQSRTGGGDTVSEKELKTRQK